MNGWILLKLRALLHIVTKLSIVLEWDFYAESIKKQMLVPSSNMGKKCMIL